MADATPAEVEQVLATCLSADNNARQLADQACTVLIKKKNCVPLLIAQLQHSENPYVRQLASVLLRRKILSHWRNLAVDVRTGLKAALIQCALNEPVRLVRLGIVHCMAMLAKAEIASGTWPELLQFMTAQSQSPVAGCRETTIKLLHACSETIASQLAEQSAAVAAFLVRGLDDPEQTIRVQTLRAAGAFLNKSTLDVAVIAQLLPKMFAVMQSSLAQCDDEEMFATAFELLEDLLLTEEKFAGKQETTQKIIEFAMHFASGTQVPLVYRGNAADVLALACESKPKYIVSKKLVEPICHVAISLLSDTACTSSLDQDEDVLSHVAIGSRLIDRMTSALPSSKVGPPLVSWIQAEVLEKNTQDPFVRKAAVMCLGSMALGCRDLLRDNMQSVVAVAERCVSDAQPMVREAALVASSMLTDYLQPQILDYHDKFLPLGISMLTDANPSVREKAAYLVDTYAENLEDSVLPYAPQLMTNLARIVSTDCGPEGLKSRVVAVQAIGSVAVAIKDKFVPFAADTYALLFPMLRLSQDELLSIRARATDTLGVVANAVGGAGFEGFLAEAMSLVAEGLRLDAPELTEYSFGFWSNMAELYPAKMKASLGDMLPLLFGCIDSSDTEVTNISPFGELPSAGGDHDTSDEESHDGSEDADSDVYRHRVCGQALLARVSAMSCVAVLVKGSEGEFAPFFDGVYQRTLQMIAHHKDKMREAAVDCFVQLALWDYRKNFTPKVVGTPDADTLAPSTRKIVNEALTYLMVEIIAQDGEKEVVASACEGVGQLCDTMGSVGVHNHIKPLLDLVEQAISCQLACQLVEESEDEDSEASLPEDHDALLIDAAFELLEKIAKAYGPAFRPMFDQVLPHVLRYVAPERSEVDHYMALSAISEISGALGPALAGLEGNLCSLLLTEVQLEDYGVRRNACMGMGVVATSVGEAAAKPLIPSMLQALGGVIASYADVPQDGGEVEREEAKKMVDNAVSAVCRLARLSPASCHLGQTLPVLLEHVPLKSDFEENESVYGTLVGLLSAAPDAVRPHLGKLISCFAHALSLESTQPPIKAEIGAALKALAGQVPDVIVSLPPQVQSVVAAL
eukprot:Rhum_TRINITY_DN24819_c0_g1::Rhum_TRINITY_DN24819_c0_g1_i1::g.180200::m.180200/K20221/IPO4, RANBP4; importin-4